MKEKFNRLQQGEKVAVFDKKMVIALGALCDKKICCRQEEGQFTCWIANNRQLSKAFTKWCKIMNYNTKSGSALQEYLKGGAVIWLE